jgi:serralysin
VSGGGYDVVWKDSSSGHYSVWSTDSSGNFLTTLAAAPEVLGTDPSLKALETTLQQDLNGDGTIGVPVAPIVSGGTTIEALGSTSVVLSSSNYYLDNIATGTGPSLKYAGSVVNAANYSTWSVIGAEQVSGGGYDVVWKDSASGHYSVWSTDSSGNFITTLGSASVMLGTDSSLQGLEPTLHQDLNGDGTIGLSSVVTVVVPVNGVTIESFGSTRAVFYSGNNYMYDAAGSGPTQKYGSAAVIAANYGTWSVIGAEKVSGGGYDVVWKDPASGHYSVWSTDSSGNFLTTLGSAPEMVSSDPSLKALEPTLYQDLNGDGTVGAAPPATAGTSGVAFAFNFTQGGTSSTLTPELPDAMPAPANPQTASELLTQQLGSHDAAGSDMLADVLHNLQAHGFLLS